MLTTSDCSLLVLLSMLARYAALSSRPICNYLVQSVVLCNAISCSLFCAPRLKAQVKPRAPVKFPHVNVMVRKQSGGGPGCRRDGHVPARPRESDVRAVKNARRTRALAGRLLPEDAFVLLRRPAHHPPPRHVTVKENSRENIQRREWRRRHSTSSFHIGPCTHHQHPQAR